jgi:hypothetical protein
VQETEKVALGAVWSVLFINVVQAGLSQGAGLMNEVAEEKA